MYKKQKIKYISADSHFCEPENFYVDRLPDLQTLKLLGNKNLMFGSDFPHNESSFPNTNSFLKKIKKNYKNFNNYILKNTI